MAFGSLVRLELHVLNADSERDFDAVFAISSVCGLIGAGSMFVRGTEQLAALTLRPPLGWKLQRPNSQRGKTRRPAGPTGNKVRSVHQPEDGQSARPRCDVDAAGARR